LRIFNGRSRRSYGLPIEEKDSACTGPKGKFAVKIDDGRDAGKE